VDLLDYIRHEGRDKEPPHNRRSRQNAKGHAPTVLLAWLSSSLNNAGLPQNILAFATLDEAGDASGMVVPDGLLKTKEISRTTLR
jgi:hypothetical protein